MGPADYGLFNAGSLKSLDCVNRARLGSPLFGACNDVKNFHRLNHLIVRTLKSKLRRRLKIGVKPPEAFLGVLYFVFVSVYAELKCGGENVRGVRDTIQLSLAKNHQGYA